MIEKSDVQIITDPVSEATCPKCSHRCSAEGLPSFSSLVCAKCGHSYDVPAKLGHFLLQKIIGMGGMGGVYRAHDEMLKRDVAIKVMRKSLGDNETFSETFLREAQSAAKINHPNIVQIYSFGKEKGQPYIVMELVLGGGLDKLMEGGKPVDQRLVMRVGEQVADGLRYASEEGMMHGDVKPENILLTENRQSKLVDFGLASASGTASNEIWGTPFYIAPEKVRRQKADHRADIYSLGGTLYHAMAGQPPFDGPDANAVVKARFVEDLKPLTEINPDVDPEVAAIVSRMLMAEPALRYPTYGSLLSDMRRVAERLGPEEEAAPSSKKIILRRKGKPVIKTGGDSTESAAAPSSGRFPSEKKIVVGRGVMAASERVASSKLSGQQLPVESESPALEENLEDDPARRMRVVKLVVMLVVLGLVGVIGGLGGLVAWRHAYVKNKEAEVARKEELRQDTIFGLRAIAERARGIHEQALANVERGQTIVNEFVAAATDFIPDEVRSYLMPPRPEPPPPPEPEVEEEPAAAAPATDAAASLADPALMAKAAAAVAAAGMEMNAENLAMFAKTMAGAAAIPAAAAAAAAPAAAPPEPEVVDDGNDMEADGNGEDEYVDDGSGDDGIGDGVAAVAAVMEVIEESALPPIVQRIRSMYLGLYKLEEMVKITEALALEVEEAAQAPDVANKTLEAAIELRDKLLARCDSVTQDTPVAEAKRVLSGLEDDRTAALGLLNDIRGQAEREAKEARAIAEVEAAKMAKLRAEEEQEMLIRNEVESVRTTEAMNIDLMRTLEFRQAARSLRNTGSNLKTQEGRDALAVAQERVARIEEFYKFLGIVVDGVKNPADEGIDAERPLPAFTHPNHGWVVQEADAKRVTVGGKTVSWQQIDDISMVMMIRFYLLEDKQATALRFRYRIRQYINGALYLETFIKDSPSVKQMSVKMAEEAIKMFPRSREEIDRLIPGLVKAEY